MGLRQGLIWQSVRSRTLSITVIHATVDGRADGFRNRVQCKAGISGRAARRTDQSRDNATIV